MESEKNEKEIKKEYQLNYYNSNKDKLKLKSGQKISCVLCDSMVCRSSMNCHIKSKLC